MSLKRKLTQDDLRKAMTEQKKKLGINKKIDSPLAKYPFCKSIKNNKKEILLIFKTITLYILII